MNVNTVTLHGGLATRVVGFVNEFGMSITKLACTLGVSESEAQTLYVRSANYVIKEREDELNELHHRLDIIAAR